MKPSDMKYQQALTKVRERLGIEETGWDLIEKLIKETDPRRLIDKTETRPEEMVSMNRAIIYGYGQLKSTDRWIYAILCDLAQRNIYWHIREEDLAEMLDISQRTVSRSVNALKKAGLIKAHRFLGSNVYVLQPLDKADHNYMKVQDKIRERSSNRGNRGGEDKIVLKLKLVHKQDRFGVKGAATHELGGNMIQK